MSHIAMPARSTAETMSTSVNMIIRRENPHVARGIGKALACDFVLEGQVIDTKHALALAIRHRGAQFVGPGSGGTPRKRMAGVRRALVPVEQPASERNRVDSHQGTMWPTSRTGSSSTIPFTRTGRGAK
jgi:hypothetical protein